MILDILHYPDSKLQLIATPVIAFDEELKLLITNMAYTMYNYNGIGLAATQINVQKRLFIIDTFYNKFDENDDIYSDKFQLSAFINPEIITKSEQIDSKEGCLSVPDIYETVIRFNKITIKYQDIDGNYHEDELTGIMAICYQHELDHLNGKVFIEYLSRLKQSFIRKKLK